ncbi:MAG: hypothetical protein R3F14_16680 [Polyangiaceae bacterium]
MKNRALQIVSLTASFVLAGVATPACVTGPEWTDESADTEPEISPQDGWDAESLDDEAAPLDGPAGVSYSVYAPFAGPVSGTEFYCKGAYHPREPVRDVETCMEFGGFQLPVDVEACASPQNCQLKQVKAYLSTSVAGVRFVHVNNICDYYPCNNSVNSDKGVMLQLYNSSKVKIGEVVFGHVINYPYSHRAIIRRFNVDPIYGYWTINLGTVLYDSDRTSGPGTCYRSHHTTRHMQARANTAIRATLYQRDHDGCKSSLTPGLSPIYRFSTEGAGPGGQPRSRISRCGGRA